MKTKLFFLILFVFSLTSTSKATHMSGGEIYWRCTKGTGLITFYMNIYRNCSNSNGSQSASWDYNVNRNLDVYGSSKPRNSNNQTINQITLIPDMTKWTNYNNGELATECSIGGTNFSCSNLDYGSMQAFYYKSLPMQLKGTPPASGWSFYYQTPCCRTQLDNIIDADESAGMLLRAFMYSDLANTSTNMCYDNSPYFAEPSASIFCREIENSPLTAAYDNDLDSISFLLSYPINPPLINPIPVRYEPGYSDISPTPDTNFDSGNIPISIDNRSGKATFKVMNGSGAVRYSVVVQVDSWRQGKKLSSIFREMPFSITDCPSLLGGAINKPPSVFLNGKDTNGILIEVMAGERVIVDYATSDFDLNQGVPQNLRVVPNGQMFATDFRDSMACQTAQFAPCAVLVNQSPIRNANSNPPRYEYNNIGTISSKFVWQTNCNKLNPDGESDSYNFVLDSFDDHCPIPAENNAIITVNIKKPKVLVAPKMIGASIGLDGSVKIQWVPPIDSLPTFNNYRVEQSNVPDGVGPIFQLFNPNITIYKQDLLIPNYPIYVNSSDILFPIPNKDWHFRMKTESGCSGNEESNFSKEIRVMELEINPVGVSPNFYRSRVNISWNAAIPNSSQTSDFIYESTTKYYVWENQNVTTTLDASLASNWYLRDSTLNLNLNLFSDVCSKKVAFRVEARDTVITYKQGTKIKDQAFDTLTFSTFSIVDSILLGTPISLIKNQNFDQLVSEGYAPNYQWYNCINATNIQGETNSFFVPQNDGEYALISDFGNCIDTSNCFQVDSINIVVNQVSDDSLLCISNGKYYQWIDCRSDTLIPNATNSIYTPLDTGYYAVVVSYFGMNDTSDCIPMFAIGINDIRIENSIYVYPNPNNGIVSITSKEVQIKKIFLRNISGKLIQENRNIHSKEWTLKMASPAGVYFMEIELLNGSKVFKKLIKR